MGFFDFLKGNKEPEKHYDPLNIKVTDLEKGYLLDYDLETWTVKKMAEYDWGDNHFSREFTIISQNKTRFLHIEDDDELVVTFSENLKIRKLGPEVNNHIKVNGVPPDEIVYDGITYYLEDQPSGYYRNVENEDWEELILFDYWDENEKHCISIEQWDENDFEASIGIRIKPSDISNILPAPSN